MIEVQWGEKRDRDRADIWQVNIKCNAISHSLLSKSFLLD